MVDTLQMTRSLGSYADVLADAGIVLEDVRDEAREIEIAYATDDSRRVSMSFPAIHQIPPVNQVFMPSFAMCLITCFTPNR